MNLLKEKAHSWAENFSNINDYDNLRKIADNYDYITFDIFDTLIKRDVPTPTDIFKIIQEKYQLPNFYRDRINAENIARINSNKKEINLDDIYSHLDLPSTVKEFEKKVEINECVANKDLIEFYNWAIQTKKVYLITDMYLDRTTIERILEKNKIINYDKLIISNEENCVKADGSLFKLFLDRNSITASKVLHIGNSFRADYLGAKKAKISAIKLPTFKSRTLHDYKPMFSDISVSFNYMNAFINNHTDQNDSYWQFGYECFGPLLFGFVKWLSTDLQKKNIKKVLFMSRDGFIVKKVYDSLGLDKIVPSFYFEASRRSLRVPNYDSHMTYNQMVNVLTVPNLTNLRQVFDSWGIEIDNYSEVLEGLGLNPDSEFKRSELITKDIYISLFDHVKSDIFKNSDDELDNLKSYLSQINFSQPLAIVDIGWGGSMQHFLNETLLKMGISPKIIGYYIGLTKKSRSNLGKKNLPAFGYAFDRLHTNGKDLERPFVGLFETLFLEQAGSVKRYMNINGKIAAERYPYEYFVDGKYTQEVVAVKKIQSGALAFAKEFNSSFTSNTTSFNNVDMFSNLYQVGVKPTLNDVKLFGNFDFFNNGTKVKLAEPKNLYYYLTNIKQLRKDLYDCQWKIGFLKGLLKIPVDYRNLFEFLHKAAN